jgi:hypothetical protein
MLEDGKDPFFIKEVESESEEKIMITEFERDESEEEEMVEYKINLPTHLEAKINKNHSSFGKEFQKEEPQHNEKKLEAGLHIINPPLSIEERKLKSRYNISITQLINRPTGTDKSSFDEDVKSRSDFSGHIPVQYYGEAMLRGMGWEEGDSIGWSNKQLIPIQELVSKNDRKGLGFK